MPLLTHDETGATSVARAGAVALAERPSSGGAGPSTPRRTGAPRSTWQRIRRWLFAFLGLAVIGPFLAFVVGWFIFPVPTSDDAGLKQVATFSFDGGEPLAIIRPENENRVKITIDDVKAPVKNAVLAAEDATFYSNPGFDITGIARAVYNQLTGGVGGGSTITQQYVKVSTGQDDATLLRKYKEVVLAVKISREQTKDEILENYLNTIYFGRGAYGIQAASQAYFGKTVDVLDESEGAMLAGLIQAPSRWAPFIDKDGVPQTADAQRRWEFVADQMLDKKFIDPVTRAAMAFPTDWLPEAPPSVGVPDDAGYHIYDKARAELEAQGITEDQINTLGLTVKTTVQKPRQDAAVTAVTEAMEGQPGNLRGALVSVDPRTGAIVAYYGGSDGLAFDYASEGAGRQPGSTFKPFALTAALENDPDVGLASTYDGTSGQEFPDRATPLNNSGDSSDCGTECTIKTAMTKSVNTVFYKLALDAGPSNVVAAAHAAGIPDGFLDAPAGGGIALGDQEVRPVDMAAAYATFATDGQRHEPYIVSSVVAADGRVLFTRPPPTDGEAEIPQQVARNVTEAMLDVASSNNLGLSGGRPVAAKTGTVQLPGSNGQNKDAWIVGFTPSISTAVWIGSDNSDAIVDKNKRPIYGGRVPGAIWKQYMNAALRGTDVEQFSKYVPLGKAPAKPVTAKPPAGDEHANGQQTDEHGNPVDEHANDGQNGGAGNGQAGNGNGGGNGNGQAGGGNGANGNPFDPPFTGPDFLPDNGGGEGVAAPTNGPGSAAPPGPGG